MPLVSRMELGAAHHRRHRPIGRDCRSLRDWTHRVRLNRPCLACTPLATLIGAALVLVALIDPCTSQPVMQNSTEVGFCDCTPEYRCRDPIVPMPNCRDTCELGGDAALALLLPGAALFFGGFLLTLLLFLAGVRCGAKVHDVTGQVGKFGTPIEPA